jgi:hypothetical protein
MLMSAPTGQRVSRQPRIIVKQVPVNVYSGIKTVMFTRDARIRWCVERVTNDLDFCIKKAIDMEVPPQIRVKVVHDPYAKLFEQCNNIGSLEGIPDAQAAQLRNDRLRICTDMALRGSR